MSNDLTEGSVEATVVPLTLTAEDVARAVRYVRRNAGEHADLILDALQPKVSAAYVDRGTRRARPGRRA